MKRLTFGISVLLAAVLMISVFSANEAWAKKDKVYKLKFGSWWPLGHVMTPIMQDWIKDIETRTGGRVKIKYYPGDQLISVKDGREKLSTGVAEIGALVPSRWPAQFPLYMVHSLPLIYNSAKQGAQGIRKMTELGFFDQEFEKNNLKLLWGFTPPPYQALLKTKQVKTLGDWKGLRLRSAGGPQKMAVEALGAVPVFVTPPELYTGLQRGVIEGTILPLAGAASAFKLEEIIKYITVANLTTVAMALAMNNDTWKRLPEDIQSEIMEASKVAGEKTGIMRDEQEAKLFDAWKKQGIEFYTPSGSEASRWKQAVSPICDKFINDNEAKGLPAKKLIEEIKKSLSTK